MRKYLSIALALALVGLVGCTASGGSGSSTTTQSYVGDQVIQANLTRWAVKHLDQGNGISESLRSVKFTRTGDKTGQMIEVIHFQSTRVASVSDTKTYVRRVQFNPESGQVVYISKGVGS